MRAACAAGLAGLLLSSVARAQDAPEALRNWFEDPFFPVSQALQSCPEPAGPRITQAERRLQMHHRAERGTTCWLSGACSRPTSYAYDGDIARALQRTLPPPQALARSSLWITVQGRVVYIEGCSRQRQPVAALEAVARRTGDVQQVVTNVYAGGRGRPPYRTLSPVR